MDWKNWKHTKINLWRLYYYIFTNHFKHRKFKEIMKEKYSYCNCKECKK